MFALRKDERKLQYSRGNILGFINTGYFKSDNVPDGFKNATHNTFSNFRKKLATEMKISNFFRKWLKQTRDYLIFNAWTKITSVSFSMFVMSLKVFIMLDSWGTHSLHKFKKINKNRNGGDQNSNTIKTNNFKTRGTQNKALKMKNRKSKCLNHLTALTVSNLKRHIIYFSRGFYNNQWESVARMLQDITNTIYDTFLIF
jgi:hypothetical protein